MKSVQSQLLNPEWLQIPSLINMWKLLNSPVVSNLKILKTDGNNFHFESSHQSLLAPKGLLHESSPWLAMLASCHREGWTLKYLNNYRCSWSWGAEPSSVWLHLQPVDIKVSYTGRTVKPLEESLWFNWYCISEIDLKSLWLCWSCDFSWLRHSVPPSQNHSRLSSDFWGQQTTICVHVHKSYRLYLVWHLSPSG